MIQICQKRKNGAENGHPPARRPLPSGRFCGHGTRQCPAARVQAADQPGHHQAGRHAEDRSEEHTYELQSQSNLVCRLLLEKKKKEIFPSYPPDPALLLLMLTELSRHDAPRHVRAQAAVPIAPLTAPDAKVHNVHGTYSSAD